jgi:hypothetical protein
MSDVLTTSISSLPCRAIAMLRRLLTRLFPEQRHGGPLDEDIWPLLVASDPDGIWFPWPELYPRPADGGRSEISNRQL